MAQASLGIVVMTAYGSYDNMARALRTGIADFITKPFDLNELRLTVGRALQRQRIQRDNVRLQTLVKIFDYSQAISSTLELQELWFVVSDIVINGTGAIAVGLWDADDTQLRMQSGVSIPESLSESFTALAEKAFASGQPQTMVVEFAPEVAPTVMLQALPLLVRDERIGVLTAAYSSDQTAVLHELLFIIATQTALAIRNGRQFHALRELDRLKSEFIGIASHELRTPLSLVLGYSSLLRNRLDGRDRDTLQHIIDGAIRIGDIVDDLVNLRRSDLQEHQLELEQADLWMVLREVVQELHSLANGRGVTLVLECPDLPTYMQLDREKMSLALAHLVDNATKFTRSSGVVRVVGQLSPSGQDVTIEVRDTGVGITPRELSRVFDRFYQVAPSATRAQTGLGIGLAIAKMFVELHGGQIQVQSVLGQGSVFQVRLPLVPAEQ
jgi:signal transduction histidine kinase